MRLLTLVLAAALLSACAPTTVPQYRNWQQTALRSSTQQWQGFIAVTPEQQAQGLMQAAELAEHDAAIFVFRESQPRAIWMKNTLVPLDVIWLDAEQTVVATDLLLPCPAERERCPSFDGGGTPAQFVVEMNAGEWHGELGDQLNIDKY